MQKLLLITLLISGLFISSAFCQMTIPRVVVQEVYDYMGSYPDNIVYPEEGSIKFRAWIATRPDYVITDQHPHSSAEMHTDYFLISFNLGNFPGLTGAPVDWKHDEIVRIEITHTPTGRIAETEFAIESGSSPIIRRNEKAIALKNPPVKKLEGLTEEAEE